MKIIGIIGEPATGKSTLMQNIIVRYSGWKSLKWHLVKGLVNEETKILILGEYSTGEKFGGTDRLAMNAQPQVESFLATCAKLPFYSEFTVLFEGDRLSNAKFFEFCQKNFECRFFALVANDLLKESRHAGRDNQNKTWLLGRKTKVANLIAQFNLPTFKHETPEDTNLVANLILSPDAWK